MEVKHFGKAKSIYGLVYLNTIH